MDTLGPDHDRAVVTYFYEFGAGTVLSGLIGRIDKTVTTIAAERMLAQEAGKSGGGRK